MLFVLFSLFTVSFGQEIKSNENKKAEQPAIEDIFQDIMLTLPSDVQADIDSVKTKHTVINENDIHHNSNINEKIEDQISKDKRLLELPEKVRKQVEEAIKEIDRKREERTLEFKEMKKKKHE
jgi:hypothetical protein